MKMKKKEPTSNIDKDEQELLNSLKRGEWMKSKGVRHLSEHLG